MAILHSPHIGKPYVSKNNAKHVVGTRCAHCGRLMNNFAGGHSQGYQGENLCHPNASNRPDCYRLVTVYNHEMPCTKKTCYEDHVDFMTYVDGE